MSNFVDTVKDIGDVAENSSHDIFYELLPEHSGKIKSVQVDCAKCTESFYNSNKVVLRYRSYTIQPQVLEQGLTKQPIDRGATVYFLDGTNEYLQFIGHIAKE